MRPSVHPSTHLPYIFNVHDIRPSPPSSGTFLPPPPPRPALPEKPTQVIRDASTGAVDAILRFAQEHGDTLALSACAAHLVDLLARAERPAVTNAQRSWFLRRLVSRLREFPCGGWELAAAYVSGDDADADDDDQERRCGGKGAVAVAPAGNEAARRLQVLKDIASAAEPGSERAAHELVEWCLVNNLGDAAVVDVCRARGATWLAKTGLSAAAMGIVDEAAASGGSGEGGAQDKSRRSGVGGIPGARGKAAYWLAKGGGGVQLERLCAEVSEGLMVDVSVPPVGAEDVGGTQVILRDLFLLLLRGSGLRFAGRVFISERVRLSRRAWLSAVAKYTLCCCPWAGLVAETM